MKTRIISLFIAILLPSVLISQNTAKNDIKVFLLAGQSNMDGYGYIKDLPDSLDTEFKNVFIYHGNSLPDEEDNGGLGKWEALKPGHGVNFSSTTDKNNLSDRFGIELSFAKKLQEYYPNQKLAFIKYSRGGTSIDSLAAGSFGSWEADFKGSNGINQYDNALNTIRLALKTKDIDGDGKDDDLIPAGIIWMQGESDASYSEEIAANYYSNLKRLMDLLRASLRTDDLPVVIGKISDSWNDSDGKVWDYGELVQYAQEKYAKEDKNATIVRSTRYYKYSDKWHYDSDGYIDLGEKFADAIYQLNKQ
ncbi:sialate O-acetylesterase [Winogradskyella forsetii]|uniref:sialate O-acetylesterase n=1 Tax=Winogradskyella forsetii TaxID=2686077 RepID=UPI0015BC19F5|nr:sialate O-acetylesterase [Winogradskyella forsetii]